jgi:pre-rRNA-processing protein IPI3
MLSESFIASFLTSKGQQPQHTTSILKDAGVIVHALQPTTSISLSLKNSSTDANCLAISSEHIFAAQAGKAVVHVYSRERGNQEATVPFPERIRSLAAAGGDDGPAILVLGTEGGRLILWEVRQGISSSQRQG